MFYVYSQAREGLYLAVLLFVRKDGNMPAPKGNSNALKHGLYARHFRPEELADLRSMPAGDYHHEINLMRVVVKRLFEIQSRLQSMLDDAHLTGQPCDVEALSRISNSLSGAVIALNSTARTHALLGGTDASLNDAFEQALNSLSIFLDGPRLLKSRADKEDQAEILVE